MKKACSILILPILFAMTALSQAYVPIPFGNIRWHYREYNSPQSIKSYNYFSRDTSGYIYQGQKFWRIDKLYAPNYSPSSTHYYLYDDTSNRKVYALFDTTVNAVRLIYDFSAHAGDTLYNIYCAGANDTVIVDSVMYIPDQNSISRKHLYVHSIHSPSAHEWVEGVGGMHDLFMPSCMYPDPSFSFICQEVNSQFVYGNSVQCPNFMTSTNEFSLAEPQIQVSTDPFSHSIVISNPNAITFTFKLLEPNGTVILAKTMSRNTERVSLSSYSKSLLIYQITATGKQTGLAGKILVE